MADTFVSTLEGFSFYPNIAGVLSQLLFWLEVILTVAVVGAIVYYYYNHYYLYKIRVTVRKQIGKGAYYVLQDQARVKKGDEGDDVLILRKTKHAGKTVKTRLPSSHYRQRLGKNDYYDFILDDHGQLFPQSIENEAAKPTIKTEEQDFRTITFNEMKRYHEQYQKKSLFEKFAPTVVVLFAFGTAIVIWWIGAQYLGGGMEVLANQFGQVAASCTKLTP